MDKFEWGLTGAEVERRRAAGDGNREVKPPTKTVPQIFATNIFTYFNAIFTLLAVGIIIAGSWRNLAFMGVVVINTAIGIIQEIRSKRTLDKMALLTERRCVAVRDGEEVTTGVHDTVLGDVVKFTAGSQIFADAKVVSGEAIVNEALITGEADDIKKGVGDELISGSFITSGCCYAELTAVGENSYASRLTVEAKKTKRRGKSEMMRDLTGLVKVIGIIILPLGAGMLAKEISFPGRGFDEAVVHTVGALIGMIPEGLYLLTTLALVASVIRLMKKRTLVHELDCIETLARVDTLCVDKTGTVTEDKMALDEVVPLEAAPDNLIDLIRDYVSSHATDNITMSALELNFGKDGNRASFVLPFTSSRKYGAVRYDSGEVYLLGAPEFIMREDFGKIAGEVREYSSGGRRVILFASFTDDPEDLRSGVVTPLSLIILSNKIRDTAPATFRYFAENDVAVKVISGDSAETVSGVALRAGIAGAENYVDARELDTDEKIALAAEKYTVFGRVTPTQKRELIKALRAARHTVAMTGDGVNDVLALKEADCSVAMASGSDVACQSAHIVLLDSDFSSLPQVVAEGRRVINNIERSASLYLWKNIFSFVFTIFSLAFMVPYPLEPSQLTLISALTIGFPSFVLAMEPNESLVKGHFMRNVLYRSLPAALTNIVCVIAATSVCRARDVPFAETSTVAAMVVGAVGLIMLFATCLPFNKIRAALFVLMTACLAAGAVFGAKLFSFVPLSGAAWVILASFAVGAIPVYIGIHYLVRLIGDRIGAYLEKKKKNVSAAK